MSRSRCARGKGDGVAQGERRIGCGCRAACKMYPAICTKCPVTCCACRNLHLSRGPMRRPLVGWAVGFACQHQSVRECACYHDYWLTYHGNAIAGRSLDGSYHCRHPNLQQEIVTCQEGDVSFLFGQL